MRLILITAFLLFVSSGFLAQEIGSCICSGGINCGDLELQKGLVVKKGTITGYSGECTGITDSIRKRKFIYNSGKLVRYENYRNDQLHGKVTEYHPDGKVKSEQSYRFGNPATVCDCSSDLEYDHNNKLTYRITEIKPYKIYTGFCESVNDKGVITMEAQFSEGKEQGKSIAYYDNGKIKVIRTFDNGIEDGEWSYFDSLGHPIWKQNWSQGLKNGDFYWYFEDTNIVRKHEQYIADMKDGVKEEFYPDGGLKKEMHYQENQLHGEYKLYNEGSTLLMERSYFKGLEDGEMTYYFSKDKIAYKRFYNKGKKDGTWVSYYENGKEKAIEVYKNGKKDGTWLSYHAKGKLKAEIVYKKDEEISHSEYDEYGRQIK